MASPWRDLGRLDWTLARGYRGPILLLTLAQAVRAALLVAYPLAARELLDQALVPGALLGPLARVLGLLGGVIMLSGLLEAAQGYLETLAGAGIAHRLRRGAFQRLLRLTAAEDEGRLSGDTAERVMHDAAAVAHFLPRLPSALVAALVPFVAGLALLWPWDPLTGAVILAAAPLYLAAQCLRIGRLRRQWTEYRDEYAGAAQFLLERLRGRSQVQLAGGEERAGEAFAGRSAAVRDRRQAIGRQEALLVLRNRLLTILGALLLAAFLAWRWSADELTSGMLAGYLAYLAVIRASLSGAASFFVAFQPNLAAFARARELVAVREKKRPVRPLPAGPLTLRAENLSFQYRPDRPAVLSGLDLELEPGDVLGLRGPSGAGKTTLALVLLGLLRPGSGRLIANGQEINTLDLGEYRQRVAAVLQRETLFSGTIGENLSFFRPGAGRQELREAARAARILQFIEDRPEQFEARLGEDGLNLSAGQRQRLAIARALVARPQLLVLDEATAALEPELEAAVLSAVARQQRDGILVIISHRASALDRADRVLDLTRK